jgi:hypothetical protein
MAAFTDYKALDFSGFDKAMDTVADKWKRDRENEAILKYIDGQGGQKKEGTSLANLDADYGKTETVAKPGKIESNPLPKLGVQVAETEEDTQRLEGQMAAGQGAFARPQAQQPQAAPASSNGDIANRFIGTVRQAGLTNPFGLGAVAAYGQAESAFSPQNANRVWNDPSESGQAGQAGGIMSWRADRLQNLYRFAQQKGEQPGNISPETQAAFLASEDPQLLPRLQNARSADEANQIMANAWKFAGYDRPGGENARRLNMTQQFAQRFGGDGQRQQGGIASIQGDDPVKLRQEAERYAQSSPEAARQFLARAEAAERGGGVQMAQAQGGPQADVPAQGAAQAQGFAIPQGMQPANRQNVDVQQLKGLIQAGGEARKLGLALFQQAQTGKNFGFMTGQDGAIYRTNDRTGALERVTEAMKPPVAVSEGQALVDPRTGQVIYQGKEKERAPVSVGEGQSLVDPRTGKIVYQGAVGGKQQQEIAARERIADERGLQGDDRKAFVFNGKIPSQAEKAPTEGQANAALYVDRMKEAEAIISQPGPTGAAMSRTQVGLSQVPVFGNKLVSSDFQRVEQAQRNFINATLRRESGAVISQAEFDNARKQYFPQPDDGPAVLEDKRRNRLTAIQGIENAAGPQYQKRQQQPSRADLEAEARRRGLIK